MGTVAAEVAAETRVVRTGNHGGEERERERWGGGGERERGQERGVAPYKHDTEVAAIGLVPGKESLERGFRGKGLYACMHGHRPDDPRIGSQSTGQHSV